MAAMLLIVAVAAVMPAVSTAAPQHQTFSASLTPVGGLVQYLPAGKSDWQTINQVTLINEGDQIRTGEGGLAKLNVVTGTQVDIFPSTVVSLNALSMGDSNSGMTFNLLQLQGLTDVTVSQQVKANDSLTVSTPTFTANIRGTKFKTGVASDGSSIAFTDEGTIELHGADGSVIKIGPGGFAGGVFNPNGLSANMDENSLGKNVKLTGFEDAGAQDMLKNFLKAFLKDNDSGFVRSFIASLVGLDQNASAADLLTALDGATLNFDSFKTGFVSFVADYTGELAKNPLSPATCGNAQQEGDETSANCPEDFADLSGKGNNLCEFDKGESVVNDPEDCSPLANLLMSAALLQNNSNKGGGGKTNDNTPNGNNGNGLGNGNGAGVGRNPGPVVTFSTTGGGQCVITTTSDVNERSLDTGAVVGVATVGSSFTVVGTNNNGWVTNGGFSIARGFAAASAGCPQ